MATNFTPEEEVEITLLLWEYERDGNIAIVTLFEVELRMASGVLYQRRAKIGGGRANTLNASAFLCTL